MKRIFLSSLITILVFVMVTMPIYALSANHWAMDSVDFAKNNGVITVNRSTLTSTQTITRKEIAYALMKIEKVSYAFQTK